MDAAPNEEKTTMARKTTKPTVTTPAGRTLTLKPWPGVGFEVFFGKGSLGNVPSVDVPESTLRGIDAAIDEDEEHDGYVPFAAAIDGGSY